MRWNVFFKIDSLEQQIKGDKRFLEEQATERESEREEFNKRIEHLEEIIKRKEKEEDKEISLVASNKVLRLLIQFFQTRTYLLTDTSTRTKKFQSKLVVQNKYCLPQKEKTCVKV